MTREDVISWLEYLSDDARSKANRLVPTNIEIACGMAIDALKAQEPVTPMLKGKEPYNYFSCGVCDSPISIKAKYCLNCGRAVKWE